MCSDDVSLSDHAGSIRNPSHRGSYHEHRCPFQSHRPHYQQVRRGDRQSRTLANGHRPGSTTTSARFGWLRSARSGIRGAVRAFDKRLMPILAGVGIQLANPPDISTFTISSALTIGRGGPIENR